MSHLCFLILTGCHMFELFLQSADVPWFVGLVVGLFLLTFQEAQTCEVPKFMTAFALVSFCRACKTFYVGAISTLAASVLLLVCISGIKGLLVIAWLLLLCILVLHRPWLGLGLPLLLFTIWQLSVLESHEVDLGSLHFTFNLLDMPSSGLETLIFLCKLAHLASWKLVQVHTAFIYGLGYKFFPMQKEPKHVPMQDLCSLRGVFC